MSPIAIQEQLKTLDKVFTKVTQNKETAQSFLRSAGLLPQDNKPKPGKAEKKRLTLPYYHPHEVIGFHSCDKKLGLAILNGKEDLIPSNNPWDWLGDGIYFWEQNPYRALQYAIDSASGKQYNKKRINTPFVLGAIIELGNCLNLVELEAVQILIDAYSKIKSIYGAAQTPLPKNDDAKRELDCAVIKAIHESNKEEEKLQYDSVRSAFGEGKRAYHSADFTSQSHLQVCLRNPKLIKGYFLPRPVEIFNPYLNREYVKEVQPKLF